MPDKLEWKKQVLGTLSKCYSLAPLQKDGCSHFLVAAEKTDRCLLFSEDGKLEETVWEGPGGVMTMEQVPGSDGVFLATHRFYSPNDSASASIVVAEPDEAGWKVHTLCPLPFVHRFGILRRGGVNYLVAATLKSAHAYKDDWTCPGRIWVGVLPDDLSVFDDEHPLPMTALVSGLYKNHGFCKTTEDGVETAYFGTENGVIRVAPPAEAGAEWEVSAVLETPVSDMTLADFDGDGEAEMMTFSPFHGDTLAVWKKQGGIYTKVWDCERKLPFLHAIWSGKLAGKGRAVLGYRQGDRELLCLSFEDGAYKLDVIDSGAGPANVMHLVVNGTDCLVAANRETDEIALYKLSVN